MIRDALNSYATVTAREWSTDRSQTVGASEIGQCARRIYYLKNEGDLVHGAARDEDHEDGWGARVRGTIYENAWWEPAMRAAFGERLLYAGPDQRTFSDGFLSATPDGVLTGLTPDALASLGVPDLGSDCIVVECKTADPRTKLDRPKPEHAYQVQVQIGLIRLRTNLAPEWGLISYTDTSFWNEVREFPIRFEPETFASAQTRATEIMTAISAADLKPEGWIAGGRECGHCPFTGPCGRSRTAAIPKEVAPDVNTLEAQQAVALARTCADLKAEAGTLLAESKALEIEIRSLLTKAGTRRINGDGVSVTWSPVKGRPSWDMKGLREAAAAAGVDLSLYETAGDPTDRLVISLSGSAKETDQ